MTNKAMKVGDQVEIKEPVGATWKWSRKLGLITQIDKHCFNERRDDTGEIERDVREHYRRPR